MSEMQNPEALHDIASGTSKVMKDTFVSPGMPNTPLVDREQMTQATIKGKGTEVLRESFISK